MPQFNPTECAGCMATSNHDAPHYEGEWPHDARGIQVTGGKHCEGCSPNNDSYAAERGSSEQPNPTATDDALAALMDAVKRDAMCDSDPGHHVGLYFGGADIRAAALAYGRAVAIAELEALEDAGTFADIAAEKRIAELRAADSTGGT